MKLFTPRQTCAVAAITLAALAPAATAASSDSGHDYANQTTYGNPKDSSVRTPPKGYSVFFVQTVGRHGARSLTDDAEEQRVLSLWRKAEQKKALTDNGKQLATDVRRFQAAERTIGYGDLSALGRTEMRGIGLRTAHNYRSFFDRVRKDKDKIATVTTDVRRTKQSAAALRDGLSDGLKTDLGSVWAAPVESARLRFENRASSEGKKMIDRGRGRSSIREHARHLLAASFTSSFVKSISDPVSAAQDIYKLYSTAPGMARETSVTFNRYVPAADRAAMSYAVDIRNFYRYGPGVKGEKNTFEDARPVLKDFFDRLDERIKGGSTAAVFRVAHGETIMPFAALIKAPGSTEQTPKGTVFDRSSNPWRGSYAGRLSGNIEWAAVRNKDRRVLVTMRYHEKPVRFRSSCDPYQKGSYFYTVSELKSCLR